MPEADDDGFEHAAGKNPGHDWQYLKKDGQYFTSASAWRASSKAGGESLGSTVQALPGKGSEPRRMAKDAMAPG